ATATPTWRSTWSPSPFPNWCGCYATPSFHRLTETGPTASTGHSGDAATNTAPAGLISAGTSTPISHHDHNDLQLPYQWKKATHQRTDSPPPMRTPTYAELGLEGPVDDARESARKPSFGTKVSRRRGCACSGRAMVGCPAPSAARAGRRAAPAGPGWAASRR